MVVIINFNNNNNCYCNMTDDSININNNYYCNMTETTTTTTCRPVIALTTSRNFAAKSGKKLLKTFWAFDDVTGIFLAILLE